MTLFQRLRHHVSVYRTPEAGVVVFYHRTAAGLSKTASGSIHQGSTGVPNDNETYDHFGFSLATGDFNDDGRDDLAVGAPDKNKDKDKDAQTYSGTITILFGSTSGISGTGSLSDDKQSFGQPSGSHSHFGYGVIAGYFNNDTNADVAVTLYSDSAPKSFVLYGNDASGFSKTNSYVSHGLASYVMTAGDFQGDGIDDAVVQSAYFGGSFDLYNSQEDIGSISNAGAVT